MYGSRPGNVDSLVVPSRDYYKYEELSDNNIEEKVTGETTQLAEEEALAGEMVMICVNVTPGLLFRLSKEGLR